MRVLGFIIVLNVLLTLSCGASNYSNSVSTPKEVLGYEIGTRVTNYAGMEKYLNALAASSPKVVTGSYGEDYEKHNLLYLIISRRENIDRLESLRIKTQLLTNPEKTTKQQANNIAEEIPVILFLNYGTDGNETAGLEAALLMAHHLAASTDQHTADLLKNAIFIITPMVNPASHERMALWTNTFSTRGGNKDPYAMEHNPPWGMDTNYNHYLVDLNRESVWAIQRENQALQNFFYKWNPVVFIDHHGEMVPFTGPGYTEPLNPLYTDNFRKWFKRFEAAIEGRFGQYGWPYRPWNTGSFYPGYWESLPALGGAVAVTFETTGGGSKGLKYQGRGGKIITLRLAADQHFHATMAVIESTVERKVEILKSYYEFWDSGRKLVNSHEEKAFIIEAGNDPARTDVLIKTLLANQVDIYETQKALKVKAVEDYFGNAFKSKTFSAGTYIIPVNQPRARMVLTMLTKDFKLPQVTIDEANKMFDDYQAGKSRRTKSFYDATAWSMPLTFGVKAYWSGKTVSTKDLRKIETLKANPILPLKGASEYGYCFAGETNTSMAMLIDLIQRDVKVVVATKDFVLDGRKFMRGSFVIRNKSNPDVDLSGILKELSVKHNITMYPIDGSKVKSGSDFGFADYVALKKSRVAVLVGCSVDISSYGGTWFLLENRYGLNFTPVYANNLRMNRYDVIIVPDGFYDSGEKTFTAKIREWVNAGGVLICLGSSSRWASENKICSTKMRGRKWPLNPKDGEKQYNAVLLPGTIVEARINPEHYLTMGYRNEPLPVRMETRSAFEPHDKANAPVFFNDSGDIHLGGLNYQSSLDRLAGTPYITEESIGLGKVILFLQDPNCRLYWHGLTRLFLNSVILSPAFLQT